MSVSPTPGAAKEDAGRGKRVISAAAATINQKYVFNDSDLDEQGYNPGLAACPCANEIY